MTTSAWANMATSCGSSRALDEPLAATATSAWSWVALEVPQAWERKALPQSDLSAPIKERLSRLGDALPGGRVMFIKRNDRADPDGRRLYLARSQEHESRLFQIDLPTYEELLDLDVEGILQGDEDPVARRVSEPIFLVCTNGKRDLCCARYGITAYNELSRMAPARVWRSSHQGGHRFAANLIILPQGLHYGRIDQANADVLYETQSDNRILLDHFRGRTLFAPHIQAAEHHLRSGHPALPIDAIRVVKDMQVGEGRWEVSLAAEGVADSLTMEVEAALSEYRVILTSGAEQEEQVTRYRVVEQHSG